MVAMNLAEREKEHVREDFMKAEDDAKRDMKKKLVIDDFESLSIIGRFENLPIFNNIIILNF